MSIITEVINPHLKVRPEIVGKNGGWKPITEKKEEIKMRWSGKKYIGLGDSEIIFNTWDKEIVLESFIFSDKVSSGSNRMYPSLHIKNGVTSAFSNQLFYVMPINSYDESFPSGRAIPSGLNIRNGYCDTLEVVEYSDNEESGYQEYIVSLIKPIILPQGGRLALNNPSTGGSPSTFSYSAVWRERE